MENQAVSGSTAVPEIIVTEPSLVSQNTSVASVAEKAGPVAEVTAVKATHPVHNETAGDRPVSAQSPTATEPGTSSSDEFTSAKECPGQCVVSVPVIESQSVEESATSGSEPDHDEFRTRSTSCGCCSCLMACKRCYDRLWTLLDDRCRLPFFLILMAFPISAGALGSVYMFSCPAADTLASAIFSTGLTLLAVLTIRVCMVMHRMLYPDSDLRQAMQTLLLIAMFITVVFFITESVMFWQMDSTPTPENEKYCNPKFVNYVFWWNCLMYVVMVLLITAPA